MVREAHVPNKCTEHTLFHVPAAECGFIYCSDKDAAHVNALYIRLWTYAPLPLSHAYINLDANYTLITLYYLLFSKIIHVQFTDMKSAFSHIVGYSLVPLKILMESEKNQNSAKIQFQFYVSIVVIIRNHKIHGFHVSSSHIRIRCLV